MTEHTFIEYYFAVNQDGESACSGESLDDAVSMLSGDHGAEAVITWTTVFTVPLPTSQTVNVTVPNEDAQPITAVAT